LGAEDEKGGRRIDNPDDWVRREVAEALQAPAPATFADVFEERKFRQDGSFATLLACEIADLD
jgi:hypothetical protein